MIRAQEAVRYGSRTFAVAKAEPVSASARRVVLDGAIDAEPGQFAMIWLPGVGQKPFSFAAADPATFIIEPVGPFSEALCKLEAGDLVTFVGPLGKGFSTDGVKRAALVGGGCGAAPLHFLAQRLRDEGVESVTYLGAASEERLVCARDWPGAVQLATDDGSAGFRGTCVAHLEERLGRGDFDRLYGCGPEPMLQALVDAARAQDVSVELSLERYMKCGVGLCGHCAMDPKAWLVCTEGPVASGAELAELSEFGCYCRDGSGQRAAMRKGARSE